MFLIFGSILFCLIVALCVHSYSQEKKRQAQFVDFAKSRELTFTPERERGLEDRFPDFPLFRQGSNRYGENFLSGRMNGCGFTAFDWHYQITHGSRDRQHTHHHHFTLVMLQPDFPLRPLVIREQRFTDRIASAFGWGDIDFESAEFSRLYHVSAPERRWAFDVLTPRAMEYLMARRPEAIHMDHDRVMIILDRVKTPQDMLPACGLLAGLLDCIPEYARQGPGGSPPPLPASSFP